MLVRTLSLAALLLSLSPVVRAHFIFVVPQPHGPNGRVVFSETLEPDDAVEIASISALRLSLRGADGADSPVSLKADKDYLAFTLPEGKGTRLIHGSHTYGVQQRGEGKPHLLVYHPKTILGDAFDGAVKLPDSTPLQILPAGRAGEIRLRLLARGKPLAESELTVVLPDGKESKVKTDADGLTAPIGQEGRFGVWARYWEPIGGEHGGKAFVETRHYATLVFDVHANAPAAIKTDGPRFATLPEATSSFGAAASDGFLYVYGGHIAPTHHYDVNAVSGRFHRLDLKNKTQSWEALEPGPKLQGMNLAAHGGRIYRVGGMQPRNQPGEKAENVSIAEAARFDPASRNWEPLPSLPEPRSSHDLVVVEDKLYVIGGWNMRGRDGDIWLDTMLVMDLAAAAPRWTVLQQPFKRRALITAAHAGRIYVVGGFDEDSDPIREVAIYDTAAARWSTGPEIPGRRMNGFSPAACIHGGRLCISVSDGSMYRLSDSAGQWEKIATTTPRIVHRLVPHEEQILVVGGAARGSNFDLVESVTLPSSSPDDRSHP